MKISELMEKLNQCQEQEGDIEVIFSEAGCLYRISEVNLDYVLGDHDTFKVVLE